MITKTKKLELLRTEELGDCRRCGLCETRKSIVFGRGDANAPLMFIGEAPGEEEDKQGLPFVGKAGMLLDKLIEAMGWTSELVYIANVLKCRPPENRDPLPEEREKCMPFLVSQIELIQPALIITLGNIATRALFGQETSGITTIHGIEHKWKGFDVLPMFHPSFVLRQPSAKRYWWQDAQKAVRMLHRRGNPSPNFVQRTTPDLAVES